MMRRELLVTAIAVLTLALPLSWASATHVRIETTPPVPGTSTTIVVQPPPAPPVSHTLHADQVKAHQIRAETIYANRIEADEIRGQIHQTKGVKIGDTHGKVEAPEVDASVIYADEISANSVVAQHVYVRDLRRK